MVYSILLLAASFRGLDVRIRVIVQTPYTVIDFSTPMEVDHQATMALEALVFAVVLVRAVFLSALVGPTVRGINPVRADLIAVFRDFNMDS